MAGKKPKKPTVDERLDSVDAALSKIQAGLAPLAQFDSALKQIEPVMRELLGELRVVRILLDEKKQYAHMDQPRPPLRPLPGSGVPGGEV